MRIEWNSDAIEGIIRQLSGAENELSACKGDAGRFREALYDANPDEDDKRLNEIAVRFAAAEARLEHLKDDLEEAIRDARRADELFRDAERKNLRLVEGIEDMGPALQTEDVIVEFERPAMERPAGTWELPRPRIMPNNFSAWRIETPEWLGQVLKEYDFNARI